MPLFRVMCIGCMSIPVNQNKQIIFITCRSKKVSKKAEEPDYDSDDSDNYKSMPAPDPQASDYYHDEVDEYNIRRDKISLEGKFEPGDSSSSDNEVRCIVTVCKCDLRGSAPQTNFVTVCVFFSKLTTHW